MTEHDIGLLPVLTTFVTSMSAGDPFRISIHSWRRPVASDRLKNAIPEEDSIMFEARVYIDGTQVAYVTPKVSEDRVALTGGAVVISLITTLSGQL